MARCLIAGCGYVGTALAERLAEAGHHVVALRRKPVELPESVQFVSADLTDPASLAAALPSELDYVFYTASAGGAGLPAYAGIYREALRHLIAALAPRPPQRLFYTSSTSVYAQTSGEWVDEASPTEPRAETGRILLEGEALLRTAPFETSVIRFGGIYGPGRTRLIERARGGEVVLPGGSPVFTNRIHRDDCAGALFHLMDSQKLESLYVGVDCEPATQYDVYCWLAEQLGASPPRLDPELKPNDQGLRSNKRCSNRRLLESGYTFLYPSFREGYAALL